MKMEKELLEQYARLVTAVGVNVQKGQKIFIACPVDCAEFGRMLVDEAYKLGAKDVIVNWTDDHVSRAHWLYAEDSVFDAAAPWDVLRNKTIADEHWGRIIVDGSDPENLTGVAAERLQRWSMANGRDNKEFYHALMANGFPWTIVSMPTLNWAKKVFPGASDEEAMDKLWHAICDTVRVKEGGDAVEAWQKHCDYLGEMSRKLNALKLRKVHYTNSLGTDLEVGMPKNHVWMGGADNSQTGIRFVANMPTEEIFSAPKRDEVNGVVYASKPLALNGNVVDGIRLTLKDGRIVDIHADQGEEVLRRAIETDEGSHYFGEIAMVPVDSPISESGLLFYNTLFDENAACHFAFGEAYPSCVEGGDFLSIEELKARGLNAESAEHVDFMVGTADLLIMGTTEDGREVVIMKDGKFAL